MSQVGAIIAVFSAKGGVGKSTVATNLACALAQRGLRIGLLDADVYGPSLPILMGTADRPTAAGGKRFHPVSRHGIQCMSMGFFLDDSSPVIWRGPMVAGLIQQFLSDCEWKALDVLVVDLPPGTGDASLTLAQHIRLNGAVIVTTPQEVAVRDVARGVAMFRQLQVPILGIVENMSSLRCEECGEEEEVFGAGGGGRLAELTGAPLLAKIPLAVELRERSDLGTPIVIDAPHSSSARVFGDLATAVAERLGLPLVLEPTAGA
jgi:ATP-binding protein involved in chromosome partitioning